MQKLTKRQAKEINALKKLKDEEIDLTDIPEKVDWSKAVRGEFYRPAKESLAAGAAKKRRKLPSKKNLSRSVA
ncbi:MAG TPA: hypothetical protein VKM93_03930 [Terriglobia bacterium]|nr:hypothetical protein [Terriglobia bacterium]